MNENSSAIRFFYGTVFGRMILLFILKTRLTRAAAGFLRSRGSKFIIKRFARKNGIKLTEAEISGFGSFNDFFTRGRDEADIDMTPGRLISPCDGYLSVYTVCENSSLAIKNSHYALKDLLKDENLAKKYGGGYFLVFRLCASDYHRYCYIDDGFQRENHFIEGELHSVQPLACEKYPVYVINRRSWCAMETEHFGTVVQTEIGALTVGGICNYLENAPFKKGEEKGRFELFGSTIVLLIEKDRVSLCPEVIQKTKFGAEMRVKLGMYIGDAAR